MLLPQCSCHGIMTPSEFRSVPCKRMVSATGTKSPRKTQAAWHHFYLPSRLYKSLNERLQSCFFFLCPGIINTLQHGSSCHWGHWCPLWFFLEMWVFYKPGGSLHTLRGVVQNDSGVFFWHNTLNLTRFSSVDKQIRDRSFPHLNILAGMSRVGVFRSLSE